MNIKTATLRLLVTIMAVLSVSIIGVSAQSPRPLEPITGNYKKLAAISSAPNPGQTSLDTILFPWSEYSEFALASTLMRTVYLSKQDEARLLKLIHFPANSSNQTRAELDYLLELQNSRTKEEIARAEYIANIGSWPTILNPNDSLFASNLAQLFYMGSPVGDWFNYQNFPATTRLLLNCIQDIRVTEFRLKKHFRRARPYHLDTRLQPLARMKSPSFASGHTLWAFTQAFLFGEIVLEKRTEFLKLAEEVRWSRELMGIHFPSDNEASRVIAWNLLQYWFKNPEFIADLKLARKEWESNKSFLAK